MSEEAKSTQADQPDDQPTRRSDQEVAEPDASAERGSQDRAGGEDRADSRADPVASSDASPDGPSLEEQVEALRTELAEHKDKYLRAVAEAENIRRRADNDISGARKFAIEGFASEILSVRDSLEIARSLEIVEDDSGAVTKMKEGLDLTLKQLDNALSKYAVEAIDPQTGDKLDPERHQAMTTQESDKVPPNHILTVIQKGYSIHDRLLRPAMVVVAKKPQDQTQPEDETA